MTDAVSTPPRPITHRRVLAIALPIMLSNATIPILGAVDTGVVGQIGDPVPIGAVGIGAIILSALYWVFGFLRMGTTGLVAQARGAGDISETGALFMRGAISVARRTAFKQWCADAEASGVEALREFVEHLRGYTVPAAMARA